MPDDEQQDEQDQQDDESTPPEVDDIVALRKALAKANDDAKRHRLRNKELEPLAAQAQEFEEQKKTAEQKAAEKAAIAEKRAEDAEGRAMRLEVAAEKGLTPAQAKRLTGSTREDLEADADELLAMFSPAEPKPTPSGRPREALKPANGDPDIPVDETDIKKLGERMFAR